MLAAAAFAADPAGYAKVDVAPTRTSIYIGSVSMRMPTFVRKDGTYFATYDAKVVPYFFANEKGTLTVSISEEQLQKLTRAEQIEFTGRAVNTSGEERRVAGRATPKDAKSGSIKVRVFVSKKIELIFNTTYRFSE